jgi:MFS family permease
MTSQGGGPNQVREVRNVSFGGLLLLGGRAGDLLGRRRVFLAGVALFTLASLVGGFADNALTLIGSRVLQGVGAAAAAPSVLALITTTYPEAKARAKALAVYAAMSSVGAATGLVAGGLLTEWLSWRWVFFVNVPLGLAVLCVSPGLLRETGRGTGRFDLLGAVTISGGLALFGYAVCRAQAYGWGDRTALVCLALAVGIVLGFVVLETRAPRPLLPLHLLTDRRRAVALGATFGVGASVFVLFYFGAQYAQSVLDASPAVAGLQFVPFSVVLLLTLQVMARSGGRVSPVHAVPAGALLTAAAMLWLSRIQPDSSFVNAVLGPIVLCAFGVGLMLVALTMTVLGRLAPPDAGVGAGLLTTLQHIGGRGAGGSG